jgi:hypothetical protein
MSETVIEFCINKDQAAPLSLVVPDTGERVRDLLADGLYASMRHSAEQAAPIVISSLCGFYCAQLVVGGRRVVGTDVIVVDFISGLVSDRATRKTYRFAKFLKKHDVP